MLTRKAHDAWVNIIIILITHYIFTYICYGRGEEIHRENVANGKQKRKAKEFQVHAERMCVGEQWRCADKEYFASSLFSLAARRGLPTAPSPFANGVNLNGDEMQQCNRTGSPFVRLKGALNYIRRVYGIFFLPFLLLRPFSLLCEFIAVSFAICFSATETWKRHEKLVLCILPDVCRGRNEI